ncbi:ectonucleoside triphosphate diphosphohydrolase 5-like [Scleropages formosus]|uniref:nucleoside diphosphate phosphatase n=1 Tax=Scleropages formosus TaxID=113540 RepID=A0A8C9QPS8_SCLFO|nr:ectonucleoside triphosphate diphosphohydrolase 5-like [Scleropages formosus]
MKMASKFLLLSMMTLWAFPWAFPCAFFAKAKLYNFDFPAPRRSILPSMLRPANSSHIFYGIMFDAGSTGTRIHVYTFIQKHPDELPILDNEMFHSVKPGLSAYVNMPIKAADIVGQMLKLARNTVPRVMWPSTPVVLRATAGLRLLPQDKAHVLLTKVQEVFDDSPFFVPSDSVGILEGTSEGILAWVTVNFLTGHLYANTRRTVGILDLGGGSTQITFLPKSEKTIQTAPADHVATFNMFNTTYKLYTRSYLGNGLKVARLASLGALGNEETIGKVFKSSCLPKQFRGDWTFGGLTYTVSGNSDGYSGYKLCYQEVLKVIKDVVHQPYEIKGNSIFYAFSYYFDRAVDSGLIDGSRGGAVEVKEFKKKAKEVCNRMSKYHPLNPFLCMDLTYITALLKEGFGFKDSTLLQLTKKVNSVETSWALGAMFEHLQKLRIH